MLSAVERKWPLIPDRPGDSLLSCYRIVDLQKAGSRSGPLSGLRMSPLRSPVTSTNVLQRWPVWLTKSV